MQKRPITDVKDISYKLWSDLLINKRFSQIWDGASLHVLRVMWYVNVVIDRIMHSRPITPYALIITVKQTVTATVNEDNCATSHRYHIDLFTVSPSVAGLRNPFEYFFQKIINCVISQSDLGHNYSFHANCGVIFPSDSFRRHKLNIMFCCHVCAAVGCCHTVQSVKDSWYDWEKKGLTELHLHHSQLEGVGPERGIFSSHRTCCTPLQAWVRWLTAW